MNEEFPEGWTTRLAESCCSIVQSGGTPREKPFTASGDVPFLKVYNIVDQQVSFDYRPQFIPREVHQTKLRRSIVLPGDVLMNIVGPPLGKVALVPSAFPEWNINQAIVTFRSKSFLLNKFLYYFLCEGREVRRIENEYRGSAGQSNISLSQSRAFTFPIAPLPEQHRIVEKVEGLLEQVNRATDRLDRVTLILRRYRQAVLAAACSGELTSAWRERHSDLKAPALAQDSANEGSTRRGRLWGGGEVPDLTEDERASVPSSWTWMKVGQLGETPDDAVQIGPMSMKSSEFVDHGVIVLNVGCVQPGRIDTKKCDFLPDALAKTFARYRVLPKDVLFTRSGTVGRCAVVGPEHAGAVITFHLLRVRPDQRKCCSEYLWAVFQGAPSLRRQTGEGQIGSTRGGFNTRLLASLDVPIPPRLEQDEIVRAVEKLFALADTIERRLQTATTRANKLPQSILSKAFSGELVPTEAELARLEGRTYETAEELLKRVTGSGSDSSAEEKGRGRRGRKAG